MTPLRAGGVAWVALAALLCGGAVVVTAIALDGPGSALASPFALRLDWEPARGLRETWRLWTGAWVHWSAAHLAVNAAGAAVLAFVGWRARLAPAATLAWFLAWPLTQAFMAAIGAERLAPLMPHYAGLSGVLHAGAIVAGLSLAWPPESSRARARPRAGVTPAPADAGFASTHAPAIEPSRITEGPWAMTEMGPAPGLPGSTLDQPPIATAPDAAAADDGAVRAHWIGLAIVVGTVVKAALEAPWHLAPQASDALGIAVAPVAHACGIAAGVLAWAGVRVAGDWRR